MRTSRGRSRILELKLTAAVSRIFPFLTVICQMSDLYPLVILSKIDKLCTTTDEDTTKVFYSRAVDDKVSF